MISSKISLKGDSLELKAYLEALKPESGDENERASYKVSKGFSGLNISVEAKDITSFRAVMNSVLNVIAIVDKTLRAAKVE